MTENCLLVDLCEGVEFIGFYVLRRCELKESDGAFRLEVELSDKSGTLPGIIWDNARDLREEFHKGDVVKIKGLLSSYREKPQARIDKIRLANENEYDSEAFIPSTPKDIKKLITQVCSFIESIKNPYLSQLGKLIFENEQFMKEFKRSPGGMNWHHTYLGGLLEHSVGVTEICSHVSEHHSELNRDLLVIAALIHDVGKIKEYSAKTVIEYSDEGRLEGHIVIGERFVRNMCERIKDFPPKLKMLLSHLMLSHQGKKEYSSPVEPMIPEGFVLYDADELDSKLNAVERVINKVQNEDDRWSEYVRLLGRYIYIDRNETNNDE